MVSVKLLGIVIRNDFCWSERVEAVRKKIKSKLYLLHRIKAFLPRSATLSIFLLSVNLGEVVRLKT